MEVRMPVVRFEQAIEMAGEGRKIVLLGNGFSIAYSRDMFDYSSLYNRAIVDGGEERLQGVFEEFGTMDFELVMKFLDSSSRMSALYGCEGVCLDDMGGDIVRLRESLINVIVASHPEHSRVIEESRYDSTNSFLRNFSSFYTTNYDFLLYWCLFRGANPLRNHVNDGFSRDENEDLVWTGNREQSFFYLHGALHFYHEHTDIKKLVYSNGVLRDQVRDKINSNKFPLIVSEGTHTQKLEKIESNKYLMDAYSHLCSERGSLFIHGHGMSGNDDHLWNAIRINNQIESLYVSIYGREDLQGNIATIAKVNDIAEGRPVVIYSAESVPLWSLVG